MSEPLANRLSCFLGITWIGAAVWVISGRWRFLSAGHAWRTGGLWLALTVAWEFAFGRFMGHSWERLLYEYEIWHGRLWVLVLAAILLSPALVSRDHAAVDRGRRNRLPHHRCTRPANQITDRTTAT